MNKRLKILLAVLGGVALCTVVFQAWYFGYLGSGGSPGSPDELAQQALSGPTVAEKAKAAVRLADCGPDALDELRRVLKESDTPAVRAACIQGLGAIEDYDSVDMLLDLMEDESPIVRGSAGAAVSNMLLGARATVQFKADGPEEERKQAIKVFREEWGKLRGSPLLHRYRNKS